MYMAKTILKIKPVSFKQFINNKTANIFIYSYHIINKTKHF